MVARRPSAARCGLGRSSCGERRLVDARLGVHDARLRGGRAAGRPPPAARGPRRGSPRRRRRAPSAAACRPRRRSRARARRASSASSAPSCSASARPARAAGDEVDLAEHAVQVQVEPGQPVARAEAEARREHAGVAVRVDGDEVRRVRLGAGALERGDSASTRSRSRAGRAAAAAARASPATPESPPRVRNR